MECLFAMAFDAEAHRASGSAFQPLHRLVVVDHFPDVGLLVHADNAVAGAESHAFRRSAFDDAHNAHGVVVDGELHPNAREAPFQVLHGRLYIFRTNISGVRVEFFEDLRHRALHKVAHVDSVNIAVADDLHEIVDFVARGVDEAHPIAREEVGVEVANQYPDDNGGSNTEGQKAGGIVFHKGTIMRRIRG